MMKWFFFPPVLSFVFLIIAAILNNRAAAAYVPETVWGMTIAAYICMCALSLFFIIRDDDRYSLGISALTQGLLLSVMSVQFGVTFMSWIGLVMFLAGLILTFFYATKRPAAAGMAQTPGADDGASVFKRADSLLEKLALPICYTDNKGIISGATSSFAEAVGQSENDIIGTMIGDILPVDSDEAVLESGKWWITQKKEGSRYYFSLSPTPDGKPVLTAMPEIPAAASDSIYDKTTGLYTDEYRKIRGPEEVSRAQRYKRPLSGLLLALTFEPGSDVTLTKEQEAMLDNAFKARVQSALRTIDCGFLMNDGRTQILLPETPQAGAKTLLSRIITLPQDIFDEDIRTAVNPRVKGGLFFYNGASRMEYGIFSAALEESFTKYKESGGEQAAGNQAA
ncbi:MAG: PAS domain-containing protein [Synergistaceae bacterium]|jgi:PAS domain-containing protein|nr:PAS domain-containing protein [Synergistaceae bacterium]